MVFYETNHSANYLLCVDIVTKSVMNITYYYICRQSLKQTKSKSDYGILWGKSVSKWYIYFVLTFWLTVWLTSRIITYANKVWNKPNRNLIAILFLYAMQYMLDIVYF